MLKAINVPARYSSNDDIIWYRAWAWVVGNVAIHRPVTFRPGDSRYCIDDPWMVTHVPTGGILKRCDSKQEAWQALDDFSNLTWRGVRIMDMPACELLACAEKIALDMGVSADTRLRWRREDRPYLEKANACRRGE